MTVRSYLELVNNVEGIGMDVVDKTGQEFSSTQEEQIKALKGFSASCISG